MSTANRCYPSGDSRRHGFSRTSVVAAAKVHEFRNSSRNREGLHLLLDSFHEDANITIGSKASVVIKPNICTVKGPETGATVDPLLVKFLIEWLDENYDVRMFHIAESDATYLNADIAFKVLGWEEILDSFSNVRLLNLSKDDQVSIELNGHLFKDLTMSRTYMESDFLVSFGKLKTNDLCGMSCILKNQFGSLSAKYQACFHDKLSEAIFDLNRVRIPDLCVVDGIIAMDGNGPVYGAPKPLGLIVVGNDVVSVDHFCARIMNMRISDIPYLRFAIRHGLGSPKYRVLGEESPISGIEFVHSSIWRNLALKFYDSRWLQIPILWKSLSKVLVKESTHEKS